MLRFKNKFRFGSSEKETPSSSSDSPRNSSESRSTLTQNASSIPDISKLTISESSKKSPSPSSNASAKVKDSASTEPSSASVSSVSAQRVASNPGLLTVKCYRSQNVQLPIDIANNKQILHALASNTNDQNTGSTLSKRLNELIQTEQAGNKSSDLIEGSSAATYLPSNITIPNATGERVTKALLYMTMEFDNNVLMIEPRGGTVDSSQWDRVVSFDVTKTVGASSTGSNFLNVSLFIRLPRNLIPEQEKDSRKHFFAKNGSNIGDLLVGQMKLPLNLRCHNKSIRLIDHENLQFKKGFESIADDRAIGEINVSIDFKPILKNHLSIEDFDLLKVIGKGSFGKVMQVMKKDTRQIYALKTLRKQHIISRMEVTHTLAERTVLARINNPFIVPLKFSFQSPEKLYLVLSFINGGELFYHLQKSGKFSMNRSRFYIAELLTALESLHNLNVIYRDLKPENILLDYQGHIALCDFGLCKLNMSNEDKTNTFCGTPEYLAPELLLNQGYTRSVDWWTLGTLLYEMLTGLPPFYDDDVPTMYKKILQNELKFPSFLEGTEAKDLLTKLLQKDPANRLDDSQEIKNHPFFQDIDWNKLLDKAYLPPFKPQVESLLDTSNFDHTFTNERPQDSVVDDFLSESVQKQFGGWTYNGDTVF
ncbi:hypothetical protein FDK38_002673 [Candidozyma auris]|nr:hypothetical protein FDK38_002673 [[Candida] auris]